MVADGDLGVEERAGGDDGGALDAAHQGVLKSKEKDHWFSRCKNGRQLQRPKLIYDSSMSTTQGGVRLVAMDAVSDHESPQEDQHWRMCVPKNKHSW